MEQFHVGFIASVIQGMSRQLVRRGTDQRVNRRAGAMTAGDSGSQGLGQRYMTLLMLILL